MSSAITIVGNLGRDPELKFTNTGKPVVNFLVMDTKRKKDPNTDQWVDGDTLFMNCTAWDRLAENIGATFQKGMRVIVTGELVPRSWEDQEGKTQTRVELQVKEAGVSLSFATAQVTKTTNGGNGGGYQQPQQPQQAYQQPQQPQRAYQQPQAPQQPQQAMGAWNNTTPPF